jgi:hypothetical protein
VVGYISAEKFWGKQENAPQNEGQKEFMVSD